MAELPGLRIIGPVAYQGKPDCMDPRCTRMIYREEPHVRPGCIGYHCAYCDEPCSSQGHRCDASQTLLEASRKLLDEE